MRTSTFCERKLTELDFARLRKLAASENTAQLNGLLDEALVLPAREMPADVVTMYTRLVARDLKTRRQLTFTLCYPTDAEPAAGFISVLSPAGLGLIGLTVGAPASWSAPEGSETVTQIEGILFQPEATGDYVT